MGTLRYWTDDAGEDHELSDHEGYVESELDIDNPLVPEQGRWAAGDWADVRGHFTGRHRAACECGWRGPAFEPDAPNRWRGKVDFRDSAMVLPEDFHDAVMAAWDEHADQVVADLRTLGPVAHWNAQVRSATAELERAIAGARSAGQSWEAIGRSLGVTRQSAWERYRHLDEGSETRKVAPA